jgi:hypothetical protein
MHRSRLEGIRTVLYCTVGSPTLLVIEFLSPLGECYLGTIICAVCHCMDDRQVLNIVVVPCQVLSLYIAWMWHNRNGGACTSSFRRPIRNEMRT